MTLSNDTTFVQAQYASSANLDARIALHQKFSTSSEHFHDWLFDRVHLPNNARVLEIGCGSGALWTQIFTKIPQNWTITLADFSLGMAETVQQKFRDSRFSFLNCDAQSLPFPAETFDGIFANHMLYHVPDLDRALGDIRRVLKQGGTLYAATNGIAHLRELGELSASVSGQPVQTGTPETLFGLENGGELLVRHFNTVTRDQQENNLRVTEVEPLIAYIQSGWLYRHAAENAKLEQQFRERIQHEIDAHGAFHITKAVGLFIAR